MSFDRKYKRLLERRFDSIVENSYQLTKSADSAQTSKAFDYLVKAMDEVSPEMALRAGMRVRDELREAFETRGVAVDFDFQGSVTNGTNIKKNSDIDLLVVHGSSFSASPGTHKNYPDYAGSIKEEVNDIRNVCIEELNSRYWAAKVTEGAKSIKVSGGSLERDVDVVPCNWYKDATHESDPHKVFLGIRIYDIENNKWVRNFPFLHNASIALKDDKCGGNLLRLIRLLKNLREDSEREIEVSSYDICGVVYCMPLESLKSIAGESALDLIDRLLTHLKNCISNVGLQASATVPHERGKLFAPEGGLQIIELKKLVQDLNEALSEARSGYTSGLVTALEKLLKSMEEKKTV